MKKYLWMSSAAVVIGALRVTKQESPAVFAHALNTTVLYTSGSGCWKLTTSLVNKTSIFKRILRKNAAIFCRNNVKSFCTAKAYHNVSAKNMTTINFVSTIKLNETLIFKRTLRKNTAIFVETM